MRRLTDAHVTVASSTDHCSTVRNGGATAGRAELDYGTRPSRSPARGRHELAQRLADAVGDDLDVVDRVAVRAQPEEERSAAEITATRNACCWAISASEYSSHTRAPSTYTSSRGPGTFETFSVNTRGLIARSGDRVPQRRRIERLGVVQALALDGLAVHRAEALGEVRLADREVDEEVGVAVRRVVVTAGGVQADGHLRANALLGQPAVLEPDAHPARDGGEHDIVDRHRGIDRLRR